MRNERGFDVTLHDTWADYLAAAKPKRLHFLSTHGEKSLYERYKPSLFRTCSGAGALRVRENMV
jgi:hypothetical protein